MTKQILYLLTSIVLMGAMCIDAFFETNYFGELLSFCIIMYICWFLIESIGGFTIVCLLDSLRYKARKVFNKDVKIIDISDDDKKRRESLLECLNKMCACAKIKDHYNYKRYGYGYRQARCALCYPLRYSQVAGGILSGDGTCRPRWWRGTLLDFL